MDLPVQYYTKHRMGVGVHCVHSHLDFGDDPLAAGHEGNPTGLSWG